MLVSFRQVALEICSDLLCLLTIIHAPQIARFMGPPGVGRTRVGPMLAQWILLSGAIVEKQVYRWAYIWIMAFLEINLSVLFCWRHTIPIWFITTVSVNMYCNALHPCRDSWINTLTMDTECHIMHVYRWTISFCTFDYRWLFIPWK